MIFRSLVCSVLLAGTGLAAAVLEEHPAADSAPNLARDASAKDLFYNPGPIPACHSAPLALRHQVCLKRGHDTGFVPDGFPFQSGDQIRLHVKVNQDGYLYVLHRGSSGAWRFLFPDPRIGGGDHTAQAYHEEVLPPEGWFEFDQRTGLENLYVFFGAKPISEFQVEPTGNVRLDVSVNATIVQRVLRQHNNNLRQSATKDIFWTDDVAPTDSTPAPRKREDNTVDGPATYTTSLVQVDGGIVLRKITLEHLR